MVLMLRSTSEVAPATDDEVRLLRAACRDYLADVARGGVGPDNRNLYQDSIIHLMGERMPAVLARLDEAEAH